MPRLTRRTFAQGLLSGVFTAAAAPAVRAESAEPEGRRWIADLHSLPVGKPVSFSYPLGHAAIIVRLAKSAPGGSGPHRDIVAYHVACPHMGCPLAPTDTSELAEGIFGPCGCHGSTFDLRDNGRQLFGRASQNLVRVLLAVEDPDIYAIGVVGLPFGEAVRKSL